MKILVLSDSHSSLRFMRRCIRIFNPDAVIHLGDHYDDAAALAEENPCIRFHQVPGNCDRYRCPPNTPQILAYSIGGAMLYMTHGHLHGVKSDPSRVISDARQVSAQAVLFGHTHIPLCYQEPDGLWVLNPGSCGFGGGSAGLIEITEGKITACRIVQQAEVSDQYQQEQQ